MFNKLSRMHTKSGTSSLYMWETILQPSWLYMYYSKVCIGWTRSDFASFRIVPFLTHQRVAARRYRRHDSSGHGRHSQREHVVLAGLRVGFDTDSRWSVQSTKARVTRRRQNTPSNTVARKQYNRTQSTQQRRIARSSADLTKPNQMPSRQTHGFTWPRKEHDNPTHS